MSPRRLLCTDLDRTLIPNGEEPASPGALERLVDWLERTGTALGYVTGRDRGLVEEAIADFALPVPSFVVGDVGTSIYRVERSGWKLDDGWQDLLEQAWSPATRQSIANLLADSDPWKPQGESRQALFKLSYFAPLGPESSEGLAALRRRVEGAGLNAEWIHSVDESARVELLDLLPPGAGKGAAIEYLRRREGIEPRHLLFAGDSGNDLEALIAGNPAVLVANAAQGVRHEARRRAQEAGTLEWIHFASGDRQSGNGNYAAGILEGIAHFWPETLEMGR